MQHRTPSPSPLLASQRELASGLEMLAKGHGPIAIDTERASTYRYDDRAFLIQLRRRGSGTLLLDPTVHPGMIAQFSVILNGAPWLLHAGHTDLPALVSAGWHPPQLLDTQIAARLIGDRKFSLQSLLAEHLSIDIPKGQAAEDWSIRPLPKKMVDYARLDVEFLHELFNEIYAELEEMDRLSWFHQECAQLLEDFAHPLSTGSWQNMKGVGAVRSGRSLAIVRELWTTRDAYSANRDLPPELMLKHKDLLRIATEPREARRTLRSTIDRGFRPFMRRGRHQRFPSEFRSELIAALDRALELPTSQLPSPPARRSTGVAPIKTWAEDYPLADAAFRELRTIHDGLAEELDLQADVLATQKQLRSVAWQLTYGDLRSHPTEQLADPVGEVEDRVGTALAATGMRPWQSGLFISRVVSSPILS